MKLIVACEESQIVATAFRDKGHEAYSCDKGVEKIKTPFAQIIVGGSTENPYYSILWWDKADKECNIGYSSSCLDFVRKWLEVCFEIDETAADVAPVVRCQNCIHAEPLDRNCELNTSVYRHCKIQRGEETKNVWHKYKKYYKDYSLVDRYGFCDEGERMDGDKR